MSKKGRKLEEREKTQKEGKSDPATRHEGLLC